LLIILCQFAFVTSSVWCEMVAGQEDEGEVVSMGTGDACVLNTSLTADGRVVMDCHAAVIARKALIKYEQVNLSIIAIFVIYLFTSA